MDDADIMRAIQGKSGGGENDMDLDDELAALEEEVNGPVKKTTSQVKQSSGGGGEDELNLSDLSDDEKKKGNDDIDIDDDEVPKNKNKQPPVQQQKPQIKPQQPKPQIPPQKMTVPNPEPKKIVQIQDIYPEKPENKYHSVDKMTCLGTLTKEKELCDVIIEYKKKIGADYDTWDIKKDSIDNKIGMITASIQDGIMDLDGYKKKIMEQFKWESKLLIFITKDPNLKDFEKDSIKKRIENRIAIIKDELSKQVEQEEDDNEEEPAAEEQKPKEEEKKPPVVEAQPSKPASSSLKESYCPILAVPKEKEKEEIDRLTKVVTGRLNEYRAAIDYFKTNDLSEQQAPAIQAAKQICIELKKIQDGKWKEVNEFKLPDPVTPQYIYGYSSEERKEKFAKIIKEMAKQKQAVQDQMNAKVEAVKKLPKAKLAKIQVALKKDLEQMKAKKEKYDKILSLLKLKFQDKWVPAPLYVESQEELKVEKINKNVPENEALIKIGKSTYTNNSSDYLIFKIEEYKLEEQYDITKPGDWTHPIKWKMEKSDFRTLFKKKIHVELYQKGRLWGSTLKGTGDIDLRQLKDHGSFANNVKIKVEDKDYTFEFAIALRQPCHDPEYDIETKTTFNVTKIYPPFKGEGAASAPIQIDLPKVQEPKLTKEDLKTHNPAPQPAAKKNTPPPQAGGGAKKPGMPNKKGPPIDKSQFTQAELDDPDNIDSTNSLSVLQFKVDKLEAQRAKIDGRTPRELMQKICKIKCKINVLKDSFGDTITPQEYLGILKAEFDHSKKLAEYFAQQKDKEKYTIVSEKLPLLIKEVEDLMKQLGMKK